MPAEHYTPEHQATRITMNKFTNDPLNDVVRITVDLLSLIDHDFELHQSASISSSSVNRRLKSYTAISSLKSIKFVMIP